MSLIPLDIPPGLYRNGTDLETAGRWRDGSLVRWHNGQMAPVGGWTSYGPIGVMKFARSAYTWFDNDTYAHLAIGNYYKLGYLKADGTLADITPAGFTSGNVSETANAGGNGSILSSNSERVWAAHWVFDNWGENLVGCLADDGKLYEWTLAPATPAAQIANSPTRCAGLIVTPERFLFALGSGGNPRKVAWSDREDNTTWTAAATNEAGDQELATDGRLVAGRRSRGETVLFTTRDAWVARYVGPPFVYGFEQIGAACGVVSPSAMATTRGGVYWMGQKGFYRYAGGAVEAVPCDVIDYLLSDIDTDQTSKVSAVSNEQFNEIVWFYQSDNSSGDCDKYVAHNYLEGHWSFGSMPRSCGVDRGVFRNPMYFGSSASVGIAYMHETGNTYALEDGGGNLTPYAESGPFSLGGGDRVMAATQLIPDEATQGDVTFTFKTRFHPNDTERTYGPYTAANPTDVRFTGRQARMRVTADDTVDWRVGIPRLRVKQMGER